MTATSSGRFRRVILRLETLVVFLALALFLQLNWPSIKFAYLRPELIHWRSPEPGCQTGSFTTVTDIYGRVVPMAYLVYIPHEYYAAKQKWPLLIYLHGVSDCGSDLDLIRRNGPSSFIDAGHDLPMIVISPQCPRGERFKSPTVLELVEFAKRTFRVDRNRIFVAGYSMGASVAWHMAITQPRQFAAIIPVAGFGDTSNSACLGTLSVWAFHGARDESVSLELAEASVNAVQKAGGTSRLTVLPDKGHDICRDVFSRSDVYDWLLSRSLTN
jgi:predicted peptidase